MAAEEAWVEMVVVMEARAVVERLEVAAMEEGVGMVAVMAMERSEGMPVPAQRMEGAEAVGSEAARER